jgi:hypothetical protein
MVLTAHAPAVSTCALPSRYDLVRVCRCGPAAAINIGEPALTGEHMVEGAPLQAARCSRKRDALGIVRRESLSTCPLPTIHAKLLCSMLASQHQPGMGRVNPAASHGVC